MSYWRTERRPWTQQPQGPVGINPRYAGATKLAIIPAAGWQNLAGGSVRLIRQNAPLPTSATRNGRTFEYDGSTTYAEYGAGLDLAAGDCTFIAVIRANSSQYLGADSYGILISNRTAGNAGFGWGITGAVGGGADGNLTRQYFVLNGIAEYIEATETIPSLVDTPIACRYVKATGVVSWFSFGKKSSTDTTTSSTPNAGDLVVSGDLGPYGSGFGRYKHRAHIVVGIQRALSDAEILALTKDVPSVWQLFEPEVRRVYFGTGAAGGTTYNASFSDAVTVADLFNAAQAFTAAMSDSVSAADVMSATVTLLSSVSESVTAQDALSALATYGAALAEAVGPADIVSATVAFRSAISEAVAALDSVTGSQVFSSAFSEAVNATDAETGSQAQSSSMSDAVSMSDTMSATAVFAAQLSEAVLTLDSAAARAEFVAALNESVDALDLPSSVVTMIAAFSEAVSVVDQMDASIPGGFKAYWARQNTFIGGGFVY